MILAIALSPSVDVAYEVDGLAIGGISRPTSVTRVAGGKALNAARVARSLGAEVRVVAALGGHSGAWIADQLAETGIAVDVVDVGADTRTCLAITDVSTPSSTSTDVYEPASPLSADAWDAVSTRMTDAAREMVEATGRGGYAVLSGSVPAGVPLTELAAALAAIRAMGFRVVVDTSGAALRALLPVVDLVKVNRAEAEEVLGSRLPRGEDAARALAETWSVNAIVTDGVDGSTAHVTGRSHRVPASARTGRYPAGSGDAYLGGLVAALDAGAPFAEALGLAVEAAERNAQVPGPGILH